MNIKHRGYKVSQQWLITLSSVLLAYNKIIIKQFLNLYMIYTF